MKTESSLSYKAVIFDLDGVITKTAATHTRAWKKTFDNLLKEMAETGGKPFREFTTDDYLKYVDGKPRYKGVASFLKSRGIELPWGNPDDSPSHETICGVGNLKNDAFLDLLEKEGAEVYPSTKMLLQELREQGIKLGVASSSKNCREVLQAAGLLSFFEARVDGVVSAQMNLKGKPEPDIFTKACELLGEKPSDSIVVEDAVSGVKAGSRGKFGLTLGIARKDNAGELKENGADHVITDFAEINGPEELNRLFLHLRMK